MKIAKSYRYGPIERDNVLDAGETVYFNLFINGYLVGDCELLESETDWDVPNVIQELAPGYCFSADVDTFRTELAELLENEGFVYADHKDKEIRVRMDSSDFQASKTFIDGVHVFTGPITSAASVAGLLEDALDEYNLRPLIELLNYAVENNLKLDEGLIVKLKEN